MVLGTAAQSSTRQLSMNETYCRVRGAVAWDPTIGLMLPVGANIPTPPKERIRLLVATAKATGPSGCSKSNNQSSVERPTTIATTATRKQQLEA